MKTKHSVGGLLSFALLLGLTHGLMGQESPRGTSIDNLAARFEQGDHDSLEQILTRGTEAIPVLLKRTKNAPPGTRAVALDLLSRIDINDYNRLNRAEVVRAMLDAISGSETSREVVEEALRSLDWLDPRQATPELTSSLIIQLHQGHVRAIPLLGRFGDATVRGVLEPYASRPGRVGESAREALAKLGDQRRLNEIMADLNSQGPKRSDTLRKLAYIKNPSTVRQIAQLLYDNQVPPAERGPRDVVIYFPYRYEAAAALQRIVDNPPVNKERTLQLTEQDIEAWKRWWEAHQQEYP
jgi:hypothetical protein